jgi:hypothetical protein
LKVGPDPMPDFLEVAHGGQRGPHPSAKRGEWRC